MLLSLITAWLAVICALATALKYLAKKNRRLNRVFHDIHIPLGICLIAFGLIHGFLAPLAQNRRRRISVRFCLPPIWERSALSCPFFWARRIFSEGNLRKTG